MAIRKSTMKIKKRILAIDAAPAAIPVNPKIPATIAIIKKMAAHLNICLNFVRIIVLKNVPVLTPKKSAGYIIPRYLNVIKTELSRQ
jgi:hypothetical protein